MQGQDGAVSGDGRVFGTYLHGIFDNLWFTRALINAVRGEKGIGTLETGQADFKAFKEQEYDRLADLTAECLDMDAIEAMLEDFQ